MKSAMTEKAGRRRRRIPGVEETDLQSDVLGFTFNLGYSK
jgi:hypothetical protein